MYIKVNAIVRSVTIEVRSQETLTTYKVTGALREQFRLIHPRIEVRCIPGTSLAESNDEPLIYEINFDPAQGVETTLDFILSSVQTALFNAFGFGVSVTDNIDHKR